MAGTLMILNPGPRKRRKSRKRRSPAQLAATRKLVALNRSRKRRPAKRRAARRAPARRRNPTYAAAPRRRRRRTGMAGLTGLTAAFMPAAVGAGGALALDIAWGMLPIPPMLKTGPIIAPAAKLIGAGLIGWGAGQMVNRTFGKQVLVGAVTVTVFNIVRTFIGNQFPQVTLGGWNNEETLEFVNAAQFQPDPLMGEYVSGYIPDYETRESAGMAGMGEYVSGYDAYGN